MTEKEIMKEFIEEYRQHPCLWDMSSELYRDKGLKQQAWAQLTVVLRKLDPDANLASTKKKVDNLRSCYFRELRKVRTSQLLATDKQDVHIPNLWYYKLISFLHGTRPADPDASDPLQCGEESEDDEPEIVIPKRNLIKTKSSSRKKRRPEPEPKMIKVKSYVEPEEPLRYAKIDTESFYERRQLDQKPKTNTFGIYVGEQLEQIPFAFQRTVAEKLISEVLFQAKTGSLGSDSRIATPSKEREAPEYIVVSPTMVEETESEKETSGESTLLKELLTDGREK